MYNTAMHYIVGLGNPEKKYHTTRHNVGWLVCDALIAAAALPEPVFNKYANARVSVGTWQKTTVSVVYPHTYMNRSGETIAYLLKNAPLSSLVVVHDDVSLPFGSIKITEGRGAGGHNGVSSIISTLKTKNFVRMRIGVGPFDEASKVRSLATFVLDTFTLTEQDVLPPILDTAVAALGCLYQTDVATTMNRYN